MRVNPLPDETMENTNRKLSSKQKTNVCSNKYAYACHSL